MIFVDTSAWYALAVPKDRHFGAATDWMKDGPKPFVTTDFIVAETLTLLRARGLKDLAISMGEDFFGGVLGQVHYLTTEDVLAAWRVFRDYRDKAWSFTDATSKVVIEKLGIRQAFAFDEHFKQFGSVLVVP
jgi:hypothetical protein